ncbi:hypothetical protein RhiirA4_546845, partial [Rhizophagus irregularis]
MSTTLLFLTEISAPVVRGQKKKNYRRKQLKRRRNIAENALTHTVPLHRVKLYYNLNDKITLVKKWIEKKLENEYIHYFKYDEFKINEEEIGRGRDIRILMVLSSYFGRHFGGSFVFLV